MVKLYDYVDEVLDRLGDLDGDVWNRTEIANYVQDGEDQFTRRTECLFDYFVIENTPQFANWQTHFERYMASQRPGWIVSDQPFQLAGTNNLGAGGRVGGSFAHGNFTKSSEADQLGLDGSPAEDVPRTVTGGRIPDNTVRILRVTYDGHALKGVSSQTMRRMDVNYETRTGTPAWFVYDKDGLFNIRVVPAATGDADYPTVNGGYGTLTTLLESLPASGIFDNLLDYWRLDEATGSRYSVVTNTPFTASASLSQGTSNGVTAAYASLPDANGTMLSGVTYTSSLSLSFSMWVRFSELTDIHYFMTTASPGTRIGRNAANFTLSTQTGASPTTIVADTWYHLVFTRNSSGDEKLYVNGVLEHEVNVGESSLWQIALLSSSNGASDIDEFAVFNGILTADQALELYNGGTGIFFPETQIDTVVSERTGFGVLRFLEGEVGGYFPSGGPWGTPTRTHVQESNIYVELVRTGRPLATHPSELPDAYTKYVIYYAMSRALKRQGPGHDEKLGDHYASRFEMGVSRMKSKKNKFNSERVGRFGGQAVEQPFGIGLPQPPSDWGFGSR